MKRIALFITIFLFFVFFNSLKINAESNGTCIIKQQDKIHTVNTPFYWYTTIRDSYVDSSLKNIIDYSHTTVLIDNKENCLSINNSLPKHENGTIGTNIIFRTTTFYYSSTQLNNSEEIFNKAEYLFDILDPSFPGNYTITSDFISLDNSPPIIVNDNLNPLIIVPLEQTINANYLKSKLSAYDEVDGIIEIQIHQNNYFKNHNILGEYDITFSATDSNNNSEYLTITIKVIDNKKPTINGQQNIKNYLSNPLTIEQIKNSLTIEDNYDTISNQNIKLIQDNYTNNINKEGLFKISFQVNDNSNNTSDEFTITLENYDDICPTLSGQQEYKISNKNKLNLTDLTNQLITKDNIDENPKIQITEDNYSTNFYTPGIYQVTYISKDKNDNFSNPLTINIIVEDTTKPTFYISKKFIGIDGSSNISIDQLLEIIEETNNIDTTNLLSYEIAKDEYSANKNIPGTYKIEVKYQYENNENISIETYIVVDDYTKKEEQKNTPKKNFWSVVKNFLIKIWNFIKYIFTFKWIKK